MEEKIHVQHAFFKPPAIHKNNVNLSTHFDGYFIFSVPLYMNIKSLHFLEIL